MGVVGQGVATVGLLLTPRELLASPATGAKIAKGKYEGTLVHLGRKRKSNKYTSYHRKASR